MKSLITFLLILSFSNLGMANTKLVIGSGVCDNYNDIYYPNYKNVFECAKKKATTNAQKKCNNEDTVQLADWAIDYERACDYCPMYYIKAQAEFLCLYSNTY